MSHDLTRWIEAADARRFSEAVMFERGIGLAERHYMHLGDAVAHLPSWLRRGLTGESVAAIGCHAAESARRSTEHRGQ